MTSKSQAKTQANQVPSKPVSSAKMIPQQMNRSKLERNLRDLAYDMLQCPPEADFIEDLTSEDPVLKQKAQEQVEMCLVGAEQFDENADQLLSMVSWFKNRAQFRIDEAKRIKALAERDTKTADRLESFVYSMFRHVYQDQFTKYDLPTHKITSRKTESVDVDEYSINWDKIPESCTRIKKSIDKAEMKKLLKTNMKFQGVTLKVERKWSFA